MTVFRASTHRTLSSKPRLTDSDRLVQYYNPTLHGIVGDILALFARPRETPLADNLVLTASSQTDPAPFTLLNRMQEKVYDMEHIEMAAECLDHMAAGIDTTGGKTYILTDCGRPEVGPLSCGTLVLNYFPDSLCFLMWEISQPVSFHVQRRLQEEIRANPGQPPEQLSYLDAVVLEGLRCFPAIPMSLPRYVPSGGRTINNYFIPESAIVSCQAYSTHRIDQKVFPQPDSFNPDRWLDESGDSERKRLFFAFASGGRGCVGKQ
jgi:hypothetical protein